MKFKVGDKVEIIQNTYEDKYDEYIGHRGIIKSDTGGDYRFDVVMDNGMSKVGWRDEELKLISSVSWEELKSKKLPSDYSNTVNGKQTMTVLKRLTNALKKKLHPDYHKQYQAGIIDDNLELTSIGRDILVELLAEDKKKELTEAAEEMIKEAKEDK